MKLVDLEGRIAKRRHVTPFGNMEVPVCGLPTIGNSTIDATRIMSFDVIPETVDGKIVADSFDSAK